MWLLMSYFVVIFIATKMIEIFLSLIEMNYNNFWTLITVICSFLPIIVFSFISILLDIIQLQDIIFIEENKFVFNNKSWVVLSKEHLLLKILKKYIIVGIVSTSAIHKASKFDLPQTTLKFNDQSKYPIIKVSAFLLS